MIEHENSETLTTRLRGDPQNILLFGADGQTPQETLLTSEPLVINKEKNDKFTTLALRINKLIHEFDLKGKADTLGVEDKYFYDALSLDQISGSQFVYGGIDVYWNNGDPKILEINTRPQVMGFQDSRQEVLGILNQPKAIDHFTHWIQSQSVNNVYVLASRQNPFWRGYEWSNSFLLENGINSIMGDAKQFDDLVNTGYYPDIIWRLANSQFILYNDSANTLREVIQRGIPIVNSLSSQFIGDRGFLAIAGQLDPDLFPKQQLLSTETTEDELEQYPWIKLETGKEFAYVVNYNGLRRWGKDALLGLIRNNKNLVTSSLNGRESRDADNLREVLQKIENISTEQLKWVAQENIEPEKVNLNCRNGEIEELSILYRVYWIRQNGKISVSFEAYGATNEQYSRSKGKINGGASYAVPVVLK